MGATTEHGFPYPDPDDPPLGPAAVQQLAEALDTHLADTGWVVPTVTPGAGYTTTTIKARIRGGVLEVYWSGQPSASGSVPANGDTPNTTVCVLPAPFRPGDHARPLCGGASGPLLGWVIATGGEIQMVSGPPNVAWGAGSSMSCGGTVIL